MVKKGRLHSNIELVKNLAIITDQFHLIVDYWIMKHETDSGIGIPLADKILAKFMVYSWSFDKGFYSKENKKLLKFFIHKPVMPKKGKSNQVEKEEESQRHFVETKNKNSAIEPSINELGYRGFDRCPDRWYPHFRRYAV